MITPGTHDTVALVKERNQERNMRGVGYVNINYDADVKQIVEGTPERPKRTGHVWHIDQTDSVNNTTEPEVDENGNVTYEGGDELFLMTQSVVGAWEKAPGLEDYEAVYVPRNSATHPPIQKVTLKYLDDSGTYQDYIRRDR